MKRREFMGWISVGAIASSLPVALAACSSQPTTSSAAQALPRADGYKPLGSLAALEQQGFVTAQLGTQAVLVIPDPTVPNQLIAVDPLCSHGNCNVSWEKGENAFVCPCHGSKFSNTGAVISGRAKEPLTTHAIKVEGDDILVKVA